MGTHDSRICSEEAVSLSSNKSFGILSGSGINVYIKWHGIYQIQKLILESIAISMFTFRLL